MFHFPLSIFYLVMPLEEVNTECYTYQEISSNCICSPDKPFHYRALACKSLVKVEVKLAKRKDDIKDYLFYNKRWSGGQI